MNRQRYLGDLDIGDCVETPAQLLAKLTAVERQLAERLGLMGTDVRIQLRRLDDAGQLVEDELVRDWHDLYATYVVNIDESESSE